MAQSIIQHNDVWTRRINNPLTNMQLLHPLQNPITIMQVYHAQHYTTLIKDTNKLYYYDGLSLEVPPTVQSLHTHLRNWYGTRSLPNSLRTETPTITFPITPSQTDGLTCALHMRMTSLADIYQGNIPILQYNQRHVDQLSRMHLR